MAVVYEQLSGNMVRAYSDAGKMIHGGYPEGDYAEAFDPAAANRTYVETEEYVPTSSRPPTPVYDKYELVMAIERAGLLEDFVTLIRSDPVLELKWNAADYLDFSDGTLQEAIDAIKDSLGVTDEQVEGILAQAEVRQ